MPALLIRARRRDGGPAAGRIEIRDRGSLEAAAVFADEAATSRVESPSTDRFGVAKLWAAPGGYEWRLVGGDEWEPIDVPGGAAAQIVHGDTTTTVYRLTHGLGTEAVVVQVRAEADRFLVYPDVRVVDANAVEVIYAEPPGLKSMRATIR